MGLSHLGPLTVQLTAVWVRGLRLRPTAHSWWLTHTTHSRLLILPHSLSLSLSSARPFWTLPTHASVLISYWTGCSWKRKAFLRPSLQLQRSQKTAPHVLSVIRVYGLVRASYTIIYSITQNSHVQASLQHTHTHTQVYRCKKVHLSWLHMGWDHLQI